MHMGARGCSWVLTEPQVSASAALGVEFAYIVDMMTPCPTANEYDSFNYFVLLGE